MKMSWMGYLRREALAGDTRARLVLRYAKNNPCDTRRHLDEMLQCRQIEPDSHRHVMGRFRELTVDFNVLRPEVLT